MYESCIHLSFKAAMGLLLKMWLLKRIVGVENVLLYIKKKINTQATYRTSCTELTGLYCLKLTPQSYNGFWLTICNAHPIL